MNWFLLILASAVVAYAIGYRQAEKDAEMLRKFREQYEKPKVTRRVERWEYENVN